MKAVDRVWSTLPDSPRKAFGSAIDQGGKAPPMTIIGPTLRMTRDGLRQAPCPTCGNDGRSHCACPPSQMERGE